MNRFSHIMNASCVLMLAMVVGTAAAEQIYRSVDAEGNVTFSNQPPANSVSVDQVDVQPGPSEAARREAQERMQRQESTANELSKASANRVQQKPPASPAASQPVEPVEPVNQYYGNPNPNTARDRIRDRLQNRPVQLPMRPTPR